MIRKMKMRGRCWRNLDLSEKAKVKRQKWNKGSYSPTLQGRRTGPDMSELVGVVKEMIRLQKSCHATLLLLISMISEYRSKFRLLKSGVS